MSGPMVSVPVEPTEAMLKAAHAAILSDIPPDGESHYGPTISTHAIYRAYWAAMIAAAPPAESQPQGVEAVAWRVRPHDTDISAARVINDARLAESMAAHRWLVEPLTELPTPAAQIAAPDHIADARKMVAAPGNVEQALEDLRESSIPSRSYDFIEAALRSQGQAVAVGDAMVERACRAYFPGWETFHPEAWKAPRRLGMRAAITAALAQQANKEQPPNA